MLNDRKIGFYLNNIIKLAAANPIRMALTAGGIFVAVLLFSVGHILSSSVYRSALRVASLRVDRSVVLEINSTSTVLGRDMKKLTGIEFTPVAEVNIPRTLCSLQFWDDSYFNLVATVFGVYPTDDFIPVRDNDGNFIPMDINLVAGRMINTMDISSKARVVVIDQNTADILFPSTDPIGQTVTMFVGTNGMVDGGFDGAWVEMRVIGVVEPTFIHDEQVNTLKKQIRFHDGDVSLNTFIYCPLTTCEIFNDDGFQITTVQWVGCMEDEASYDRAVSAAESLSKLYEMRSQPFSMDTKESFIEKIEQQQSHTKTLLGIGMAVLCVISGLSIMSIAMFSVKERVQEIGIRKAFGATGTDIAVQIILEMMVLSLIVSIVAVCISFFICKGVEIYVTRKLLMSFSLMIPNVQLLLPIFVGGLTTFLCSLLPAVYAAKLNVTNALKFE